MINVLMTIAGCLRRGELDQKRGSGFRGKRGKKGSVFRGNLIKITMRRIWWERTAGDDDNDIDDEDDNFDDIIDIVVDDDDQMTKNAIGMGRNGGNISDALGNDNIWQH